MVAQPAAVDPRQIYVLAGEAARRVRARNDARAAESDWRAWLEMLYRGYVARGFAPYHAEFWAWVWALEYGVRARPFVGIWPRGYAKSTSAELACAAVAARKTRRYGLYVCHERGTTIFDPDSGAWMNVEDHPTALERRGDGYSVQVWGLPFRESVTPEHRYWARRIARRDPGHGRPPLHDFGEPGWIEARHLDRRTWIGLPIDFTVEVASPLPFDAPEWWWFVGLWWGDGTLGGPGNAQISVAVADKDGEVRERLIRLLDSAGLRWGESRHSDIACSHINFYHPQLAGWLAEWRTGGNSQKCPPRVAERLSFGLQRLLMQGYIDADGWVSDRSVQIASVALDGLLAARRILARLGIAATIKPVHRAGAGVIQGRAIMRQDSYALRFQAGASLLGYPVEKRNNYAYQHAFIQDGWLWSRVRDIGSVRDRVFVPITTSTSDYLTAFGRSHNCETQEQADDHVANVAGMLEAPGFGLAYPETASRKVGKYGNSRGWRRNRLRTASGFTLDAIGLDTAARGVKLDEDRPDLLVFDDLDGKLDSAATTERKLTTLTHTLLPAGSDAPAVLAIQNLVLPDGIFARLADSRADFLADRIVSGPHPAVRNITTEQRDGRTVVTGGEPTWAAMGLEIAQAEIDEMGLTAYRAEKQHDVEAPAGGLFDHLEFRHCRWDELPDLVRLVVWVDPAVTDTDQSDSHAIQADGLAPDGTIYRLWSWENRTSPEDSLRRAIAKAVELRAECVGVETDQGGDAWASVYREAARAELGDAPAPTFRQAKAGAGHGPKVHRASQMLADYERGRFVHVVGTHETLERALRRFPRTKPLDLVDASYWCWSDLRNHLPLEAPEPVAGRMLFTSDATTSFGAGDQWGADPWA